MINNYDNIDTHVTPSKQKALEYRQKILDYIEIHPRSMKTEYTKESQLQDRIIKAFNDIGLHQVMWWTKVSDRYISGVPDIVTCICGMFVTIELKLPKGKVSPIQEVTMNDIRNAGGITCTSTSLERSLRIVARVLEIYATR